MRREGDAYPLDDEGIDEAAAQLGGHLPAGGGPRATADRQRDPGVAHGLDAGGPVARFRGGWPNRAGLFYGWCLVGKAALWGAQVLLSVGARDGAGCQSQYFAVRFALVREVGHYPSRVMDGLQILTGRGS